MMNSRLSAQFLRAAPGTPLGRLLNKMPNDRAAISEIYLRTLSRLPSAEELRISTRHLKNAESRTEGFEDLQWALLNSTEFLYRR